MTTGTETTTMERLWGAGELRVFISHRAEDKILANDIKNSFENYGVASFVAHEDIEPMTEWLSEIERALFSMDLLVALLTDKFKESNWTDQEIGIAIGREVPVIPARIGRDPYGFIGKYQALQESNASKIVDKIIDHLLRYEGIDGRLKQLAEEALASLVADDSSVERAHILTRVSSEIDRASPELAEALRKAFNNEEGGFNIENVFETLIRGGGVSDRLKDLAKDVYISEVTNAGSFMSANHLAGYLPQIDTLSIPQAEFLMRAFNENGQVRYAFAFAPIVAEHLSPAAVRQFFRIIDEQADHMHDLVADLLDVARIETGTLPVSPEPAEVAVLVDRARSTFSSAGGRNNLAIDIPPDLPLVMADRRRIVQVVGNLLSNAANHSSESSVIRISAVREDFHVAVSVADEGRGIPSE